MDAFTRITEEWEEGNERGKEREARKDGARVVSRGGREKSVLRTNNSCAARVGRVMSVVFDLDHTE